MPGARFPTLSPVKPPGCQSNWTGAGVPVAIAVAAPVPPLHSGSVAVADTSRMVTGIVMVPGSLHGPFTVKVTS